MKVEIYERATDKVVEVVEVDSMEDFRFYWREQGNSADFGYRVVEEPDV